MIAEVQFPIPTRSWLRGFGAYLEDHGVARVAAGREVERDELTRKPQPSQPTSWDIYRAAAKAKLIGTVEAVDERAAIEKAAKEFKTDASKLIAVQRR